MPHTLNKANQPIKQPIKTMWGKIVWPAAHLAQAKSPRSGERGALA